MTAQQRQVMPRLIEEVIKSLAKYSILTAFSELLMGPTLKMLSGFATRNSR